MTMFHLKGALVEYGSDFMGPIPNVVVFQFNPEEITRTLNIPPVSNGQSSESNQAERGQASSAPTESFSITAHFSAADDLGSGGVAGATQRIFGIGPQLAALEKMVYPASGLINNLVGAAIDAIGDALRVDRDATQAVPPEQLPSILFIWGPSRILPVRITSMVIKEQKYDMLLNPVQAEVTIGLEVANSGTSGKDLIGQGALAYTQTVKEAQAVLNLGESVEEVIDMIPF